MCVILTAHNIASYHACLIVSTSVKLSKIVSWDYTTAFDQYLLQHKNTKTWTKCRSIIHMRTRFGNCIWWFSRCWWYGDGAGNTVEENSSIFFL